MSECCINTMKSELIESIDKYKIISEMPLGRRKLQATKTVSQPLSLNGESLRLNAADEAEISDNNNASSSALSPTSTATEQILIVAAMQDHISCTKLKSSASDLSAVAVKEEEMEKDLTKMTFELDHMYANCSSGVSLNSLAASQAHSAAAIVADDLLPEHEQIRCLKELIVLHLDLISQEQSKSHMKDLEIQQLKKENETLKQQLREVTKCRRKSTVGKKSSGGGGDKDSAGESESESGEEDEGKRSSRRHRRGRRRRKGGNDAAAEDDDEDHRHRKKRRKSIEEKNPNTMYSHQLYYTPVGDEAVTSENIVTASSSVQVPGWRVRVVTSCYQMEGTENLDDDIFLKRHQKLEIDEKRRKRWDIQRIREQRMQERLRLGRQAKKKTQPTKNNSFNSFYPDADKVQMLEVSEVLPVSAFGRTVSRSHNSEFGLPWNG